MSAADRFRLDGKVTLVTGASSGLGVAFATGFAEAGSDVVVCARRMGLLEKTKLAVEERGQRCMALSCDVADPLDCHAVVAHAIEVFGRLDVLINNAGIGTAAPATREDPAEFRRVIEVNLLGAYWMSQSCGRVMPRGSSIVMVGSVLGFTTAGLPQAAYSASKAALVGLTRDLAQQWTARKGIRVNLLAPGFFPSEMTAQYEPGYLDGLMARVPMGRAGKPDELAATAIFLASDAASYITGASLPVDGGFLVA
jgi:NAD(P)-dependent dehydrogenase (short-subunit alcohol dehydrogenase family)